MPGPGLAGFWARLCGGGGALDLRRREVMLVRWFKGLFGGCGCGPRFPTRVACCTLQHLWAWSGLCLRFGGRHCPVSLTCTASFLLHAPPYYIMSRAHLPPLMRPQGLTRLRPTSVLLLCPTYFTPNIHPIPHTYPSGTSEGLQLILQLQSDIQSTSGTYNSKHHSTLLIPLVSSILTIRKHTHSHTTPRHATHHAILRGRWPR